MEYGKTSDKKQGSQKAYRESETYIVPKIAGNAEGGKVCPSISSE